MIKKHEFDNGKGNSNQIPIFYWGEVISIEDEFESREIKVRVSDFDGKITNQDLPPCYPLLPAFFHFVPQVGERVAVFMMRINNADKKLNQEKRYYITVSKSRPEKIDFDPKYYSANSNESDGWLQRLNPISKIPNAKGTYLEKDEVGIVGKDNTDIILRKKEVLVRAGKHDVDDNTLLNTVNPAFIQMKYSTGGSSNTKKFKTITQTENIPPTFAINVFSDAQNRLQIKVFRISDSTVEKIFSDSYSSRESLIEASRGIIRKYQEEYPKWELRTDEEELQDLPKLFKGNTRLVRKQVEVFEENEKVFFKGSVINMVADKLNFLSHLNGGDYNLISPRGIDEENQLEVNSKIFRAVNGEPLLEFLNLLVEYVKTHVHPYAGLPVDRDVIVQKLESFNLQSILNQNIGFG